MMPNATCQNCGWTGPADRCGPLVDLWERVQPGDVMPAGECPECRAAAMLDETPAPAVGEPRLQPVCNRCGGTDFMVDAFACWDIDAQGWELHSTYEANAWCRGCEGEASFSMKPVTAGDE